MANANEQLRDAEQAEAPARNVVEAIARVMRDLPGIGRDSNASAQQGGYAYRGIEAITREASVLFAREGVVFVPHVRRWERDAIVVNGKPWTDDRIEVAYSVYGPGGRDDVIEVGPIPSIGRDNSDKGANKCMTQAYKYALLQVLCISDKADDADGSTHERDEALRLAEPPTLRSLRDGLRVLGEYPEAYKAQGWPSISTLDAMIDGQVLPMETEAAIAALSLLREIAAAEAAAGNGADPASTGGGDSPSAVAPDSADLQTQGLALADAAALAAAPCYLCGSSQSKRVTDAHDRVRCSNVAGCEKRQRDLDHDDAASNERDVQLAAIADDELL